jgi:hypothetical protein
MRNAFKISVLKGDQYRRPRCRWNDNIKRILKVQFIFFDVAAEQRVRGRVEGVEIEG